MLKKYSIVSHCQAFDWSSLVIHNCFQFISFPFIFVEFLLLSSSTQQQQQQQQKARSKLLKRPAADEKQIKRKILFVRETNFLLSATRTWLFSTCRSCGALPSRGPQSTRGLARSCALLMYSWAQRGRMASCAAAHWWTRPAPGRNFGKPSRAVANNHNMYAKVEQQNFVIKIFTDGEGGGKVLIGHSM